MTSEQTAILAKDVAEWTLRMRESVLSELSDLIAEGNVIPNFSAAHSFCDANVLGDFEDGCEFFTKKYGHLNSEAAGGEFDIVGDVFFGIVEAVQVDANKWLVEKHMGNG